MTPASRAAACGRAFCACAACRLRQKPPAWLERHIVGVGFSALALTIWGAGVVLGLIAGLWIAA